VAALRIDDEFIDDCHRSFVSDFDPANGGFGSAPKFPARPSLQLLLIRNKQSPNPQRMQMPSRTLDAFAHGGIGDHLAEDFTLPAPMRMLVPHLRSCSMTTRCWRDFTRGNTGRTGMRGIAAAPRDIFDFCRGNTSPEGAFYTAFDAE